jgi:hypothetical protein
MGIIATPDFLRLAQITGDSAFLDIAELTFMACNENVGCKWGYAMEGMQEEGLLLSPWLIDDPMFAADTGFGGRSKGEGNKTCLPWISAVTVWAGDEIKRRFGTLDFDELRKKFQFASRKVSVEHTSPNTESQRTRGAGDSNGPVKLLSARVDVSQISVEA